LERTPLAGPGKRLTGAEGVEMLKHIARHGFVLCEHGKTNAAGDVDKEAGMLVCVLRNAGRKESRILFAKPLGALIKPEAKTATIPKPGNRKVAMIDIEQPDEKTYTAKYGWWVERGEDLVIFAGRHTVDTLIATIDKKQPSAVDHPVRAELAKPSGEFQPVFVGFVDVEKFPSVANNPTIPTQLKPPTLKDIGLEGLNRIDYRWGFEDRSIMSELRFSAPAPRKGWLALMDLQPPFGPKSLPSVPAAIDGFTIFSFDVKGWLEQSLATAKEQKGTSSEGLEKFEKRFKKETRLRFREDVLGKIGPRMVAFSTPTKASSSPFALFGQNGFQVPKVVLMAELKDPAAIGKAFDDIMIFANREIDKQFSQLSGVAAAQVKSGSGRGSGAPKFKATNPKTYSLSLPTAIAALTNLNLTVAVGKKHLVIATAADAAKKALALEASSEGRWKPSGAMPDLLDRLPEKMTLLQVQESTETLPKALAGLPAAAQALASSIAGTEAPGASAGAGAPGVAAASPPPASGGESEGRRGRGKRGGGPMVLGPSASTGAAAGGAAGAPGAPGAPAPASAPGGTGSAAASGPILVDPAKTPSADAIKPFMFPSTAAMTVDHEGVQVISREAFPDLGSMFASVTAFRTSQQMAKAMAEGRSVLPPGMAAQPAPPGAAPPRGGGGGGNLAEP
jgi:hypothetical protein